MVKEVNVHPGLLKIMFFMRCMAFGIPLFFVAVFLILKLTISNGESWPRVQATIINSKYVFSDLVIYYDYQLNNARYVGSIEADIITENQSQSNPRLAVGRHFDIKVNPDDNTDVYIEYAEGSLLTSSKLVTGNQL